MYRDDNAARAARANVLIDEIASLERSKVEQAATEQRLDAARHELSTLQPTATAPERSVGFVTHACVFTVTAAAAFVAYALMF